MTKPKNILVAPLNWGLGHATRCIPIIRELQINDFTPILASDGDALKLLKKEFPLLECIELPSYHIKYPKNGTYFRLKLLLQFPKLISAVKNEKKTIESIVAKRNISGIISDNRFGVYHKNIPSVYITHQLNVLSGITTALSSKIHQDIIKKFDECWVPDSNEGYNYSGKLGHIGNSKINLKYIGLLSRFKKKELIIKYDYLVLLSGPEPQRTILEKKLYKELKNSTKKILFIKGKIESEQKIASEKNITSYNYMTSNELETAINESELIIARSGYTTIMDLAKMNKKAFFIPTPGQFEQMYLAQRLQKLNHAPYCSQDNFCIESLTKLSNYKGLNTGKQNTAFSNIFAIFN